jgi:hypothetical protein
MNPEISTILVIVVFVEIIILAVSHTVIRKEVKNLADAAVSHATVLTSNTKAALHLAQRVKELEEGAAEAARVIADHKKQIADLLLTVESLHPPF